MVNIRQATVDDLPAMQTCNLMCLPENYHMKYVGARPCCAPDRALPQA